MKIFKGRAGLLAFALLIAALAAASAGANTFVHLPSEPVHRGGPIDARLLSPLKDVFSGRAWLVQEGWDPALLDRGRWSALTRMDWDSMDSKFSQQPRSSNSHGLQAPGGAAALVPFRDPAPAFSRDILVTRDYSRTPFQTEPHLAVNPNDPNHLILGVIDYNFPSTSSYVSLDGGVTWDGPFQVPFLMDDRVSGGDPVLAFDREGNAYYTSISIGIEEFAVGPLYLADTVSSIVVSRSEDGGYTWPQTISTARSRIRIEDQSIDPTGRLRGTIVIGFLDKPWIAVGPHPDDPSREVIYVTYTDFDIYYEIAYISELAVFQARESASTIRLVRSEDGGRTWSAPVAVSPTVRRSFGEVTDGGARGLAGTDRVVQGAQPVVDSQGNVYVTWLDSTDDGSMEGLAEIHVARSEDGGRTFSTPVIASIFNEIAFRPRNAYFRYWGGAFPQFAIGPGDELYIVYTARPPDHPYDDGDIYFIRSLDQGETWSRPVRLNDDDPGSLQFFPSIDVDPDGNIHVMWGDMRDDPSQIRYHIYYSRSEDQGRTWGFELESFGYHVQNTRVTDFPSNPNYGFPNGLFIGDYFSIKAASEDVYMVWADTRLGEFGPLNQKIGFSRQRAIRSPDIFVSPPAGAGGQNVTIQGFDFQPEMDVFIQLQDATVASTRTNKEGRFTSSFYIPVTGEGAQILTAFDESGNAASTSFYTEFGFDTIEHIYHNLLQEIQDLREALGAMNR